MELELASVKERLRIAEDQIQKERNEMTTFQSTMNNKIKYFEDERVKYVSNNEVLNEKLKNKEKEKNTIISTWEEK